MSERKLSDKAMMIIAAMIFLATVIAFVWLWFGYQRPDQQQFQSGSNLTPVDVSGVDSKGKTLLDGLKNNSGIPISAPTGKMGRTDPFASL